MRNVLFLAAVALCACAGSSQAGQTDAFDRLKALVGEWEADLPGFGKVTNSIRMVSNGIAIEETIGTPADHEVSIYTRDVNRILLTHFCALTPDGHAVRLEATPLNSAQESLVFVFRDATNLHGPAAPHMVRVVVTLTDADHFAEQWTKTEKGTDTVFALNFVCH